VAVLRRAKIARLGIDGQDIERQDNDGRIFLATLACKQQTPTHVQY